jgi:hypothetical protein
LEKAKETACRRFSLLLSFLYGKIIFEKTPRDFKFLAVMFYDEHCGGEKVKVNPEIVEQYLTGFKDGNEGDFDRLYAYTKDLLYYHVESIDGVWNVFFAWAPDDYKWLTVKAGITLEYNDSINRWVISNLFLVN